jgi:hypothetical protein
MLLAMRNLYEQEGEQYNTDLREEETLQDMKENDWIISEIWNRNLSPKPWLKKKGVGGGGVYYAMWETQNT